MYLQAAVFLTALGLVFWVLGMVFGYYEIAAIGGVVVVGIGVAIASGGVLVETGQTEVDTENGTEIEYEYSEVETPSNVPLGELVILVGGVGVLHAINRFGTQ